MIYPIHIIGSPVLRKVSQDIEKDYPDLDLLIKNMYETMYNSAGVGLAAPQIGVSIRLFVIDTEAMVKDNEEDEEDDEPQEGDEFEGEEIPIIKKVFINAHIVERTGDIMIYDEGCLSVPGMREEVEREDKIRIKYCDENFNYFDEYYEGIAARVIQHEYDHIDGKLFTDHLSAIRKRLIKKKLANISKGVFEAKYKVILGNGGNKRK